MEKEIGLGAIAYINLDTVVRGDTSLSRQCMIWPSLVWECIDLVFEVPMSSDDFCPSVVAIFVTNILATKAKDPISTQYFTKQYTTCITYCIGEGHSNLFNSSEEKSI